MQSTDCGLETVALKEGAEKPAHLWNESKKAQRDGLWSGEEARKIMHTCWLFLGDACDGIGGESSLEDVLSVFTGQDEALCLWSQHNGKVAGDEVPFLKGLQQLREMGPYEY